MSSFCWRLVNSDKKKPQIDDDECVGEQPPDFGDRLTKRPGSRVVGAGTECRNPT